ncbi:FtsX-like permease family protein [Arthrobacter sp. UM1]|uniref:FtsX-like permease family protein n=1 Tax=Arthrobacter sp. UM1 TaxID=2766776 RepID=UPI001CF6B571|nr:FtsX-like permease family protein [Arthrobacter sp. UM1]MCB4208800.1 FtsX-like permease family protein [Arthrobacter sp. UM1]
MQLLITAFSTPDGGFDVLITGSGTLDNDGNLGAATEHYSPMGSGREDLLSVAGTVGVVCLFLTAATLSMTVGYLVVARVKELGALRLLGATSGVLRKVLSAEVAALALVASLAGSIISVFLAPPVLSALRAAGYVSADFRHSPSLLGIVLTVLVTVGVSVLGARRGSRRALDVTPILASRDIIPARRISRRRWLFALLGLMGIGGFGLLASGSPGDGAVGLGLLLPMAMGLCVALLAPVLIPAVVNMIAGVVKAVRPSAVAHFGAETARSSRDAVPVVALPAVLFVGIAGAVTATLASDAYATNAATRAEVKADVVATAIHPNFSPEGAQRLGAGAVDAPLRQVVVATDRDTALELNAEGIDPEAMAKTRGGVVVAGDLSRIRSGGVALSRQEAADDGYRVGQTLTFVTPDRKRHSLPIVAIVGGSSDLIPQVMLGREWAAKHMPGGTVERAYFTSHDPEGLAERLEKSGAVGQAQGVDAWADDSARAYAANSVKGVAVVLLPAGVFSMLAVTNAVLMWYSTRRGEIEALARIGMTSGQRRSALLWWAGIVTGAGCAVGSLIVWGTDLVVRIGLFKSPVAHLGSFPFGALLVIIALMLVSAIVPILVVAPKLREGSEAPFQKPRCAEPDEPPVRARRSVGTRAEDGVPLPAGRSWPANENRG